MAFKSIEINLIQFLTREQIDHQSLNQDCLLLMTLKKLLYLKIFSHKLKHNGKSSRGIDNFSNNANIFHLVLKMVLDQRTNLQFIIQIKSKLEMMAFVLKLHLPLLLGKHLVVIIIEMVTDLIYSNCNLFRRATVFW